MKSLVREKDEISEKSAPRRLHIVTFGCQMNEYDSQRMAQMLMGHYCLTPFPEEADLIIVNTCSIREKAEHKLYSLLGRLKRLKKRNPALKIGVAGCVAQQLGEMLFVKAPYVDFVMGPQGLYDIVNIVKRLDEGRERLVRVDLDNDFEIPHIEAPLPRKGEVRAFVTIMQGCDNFCTYCIVPFVRGREISRPSEDILQEIGSLVDQGVRDIILLGQNVNSYGKKSPKGVDFPGLLKEIDRAFPEIRLRFTTSHPKDLSDELIECFGGLKTLCEHLHLPVQSGSDQILKRMNRRYSRAQYLQKVEKLRKVCPDITITTDLIVGFPGETEEDFRQTMSLLEEVRFDQAFAFKYSERPGTAAAKFQEKVPEDVKSRRLTELLKIQNQIGLEQYRRFENRVCEVLVESSKDSWITARTRGNHVVNMEGAGGLVGQLINVYIERACHHSLIGRIVH